MNTVAIIMGTRPEIIKLAPVIAQLQDSTVLRPLIILTGQHDELATTALGSFGITPDINLGLMTENQSPSSLLTSAIAALDTVLGGQNPVGVVVQGDTTSALAGALASFHLKIPVAHVEAGLRTYDLTAPFPEEMNRTVLSRLATIHFCPTARAQKALESEAVPGEVHLVGNTVVDALLETAARIDGDCSKVPIAVRNIVGRAKKLLYVTGHRRENFSEPIRNLCGVLRQIVHEHPELEILFPVHPNPNVKAPVKDELAGVARITLLEPLNYEGAVYVLRHASLVITDSGGIQEEAPSFGVPVLVTRRSTERPEAVEAGVAELVNLSEPERIVSLVREYLRAAPGRRKIENPFGDGRAAGRIRKILEQHWGAK